MTESTTPGRNTMGLGCMIRRGSLLLLGLLAGLESIAFAQTRLVEESTAADGSWQVSLEFTAQSRGETGPRRQTVPLLDPISGETSEVVLEDDGMDVSTDGILLALPAGASVNTASWTTVATVVSFQDGSETTGADASSAVTASAARVGAFSGVQVTIDPAATRDASGATRTASRIDVTLRVPKAGSVARAALASGGRVVLDDTGREAAAGIFANPQTAIEQVAGSAPGASRLSAGPSRLAIPSPPGTHRVTYNEGYQLMRIPLASIGATVETVDQVGVTHHGSTVSRGGVLGTDLWIFAPRRNTLTDSNDSVFTSVGVAPSPEMATRNAYDTLSPSVTPVEVSIPRQRRWDMNQRLYPRLNAAGTAPAVPVYERSIDRPVGERFPFHRARNPAAGGSLASYTYQLPVLDVVTTNTMTLTAGFNGVNSNSGLNPDHYAIITLAGLALPQVTWDNIAVYYEHSYNVLFGAIPAPGNWALTHTIPNSAASASLGDWQNLISVELSWQGKPRVIGGRRGDISLNGDVAPRLVTIGGFPAGTTASEIYLLDITDPAVPIRLLNPTTFADETGGVAIEFEAPETTCQFYVERVVVDSDIVAPNTIVAAETLPATLPPGTTLRAIYVRQPSLATALAPLVQHRGPGIVEFEPQAAFNAFNGGQQSPEAIRDAIKSIIEEAPLKVAIPTVLLVGHGSLDRRNLLGLSTYNYPQLVFFVDESVRSSGFTIENSIDYPFTMLFGNDNLPDVRLGRLPVRDAADLTMAITRNLAHDAATATLGAADRPGLFIADDQAVGDPPFVNDQPSLVALWATNGRPDFEMVVDSPSPDLGNLMNNAAVKSALETKGAGPIDRGVSYAFYVGHGQFNTWAGETIATSDNPAASTHIGQMNTLNQWPVALTFTCLNGYYAFPGQTARSMCEAWLFHNNRGAVANIAPVSVDFYGEQKLLQDEMARQLGRADAAIRPKTLGQAWFQAQTQYASQYPTLVKTLREFVLFGDPDTLSMVVDYNADLEIALVPDLRHAAPGDNLTYDLTVTNQGAWEARDVEVLVALPVGLSYLTSNQSWGSSNPSGQSILFNLGTLAAGETATGQFIVNVDMTALPSLDLSAVASSDFPLVDPLGAVGNGIIVLSQSDYMGVY